MLDGILGRGFGFKCKSLIKAIRVRIVAIRRAEAKQRFLKEDLAKLLANGLDINAYGRTEEFLTGLSILWCYDFIEKSCEHMVKQLSIMDKQRDCPEECRESIASLMFAAARFSDLPELRDLRDICQQQYGSYFEAFVNRTFNEKLSSIPPDPVKKLQVLHDITSEFSIKWDSKDFEQRMGTPSLLVQVDFQKINGKQWDGFLDKKNTLQRPGEGNTMNRDISADCYTVTRESVKQRQKSSCKSEECIRGDNHYYPVEKYDAKLKPATTSNSSNFTVQDSSHIKYAKHKNGSSRARTEENSEGSKPCAIVKGYTDFENAKSSYSSNKKICDKYHLVYKGHNNGIDNSVKGERSEVLYGEKDVYDSCFAGHRRKTDYSSNSSDHFSQRSSYESVHRRLGEELSAVKSCSIYPRPPPYVKDKDSITRPPPYTKPIEDKQKSKTVSTLFGPNFDENFVNPSSHNRGNEVLRAWETLSGRDHQGSEEEFTAMGKIKSNGHEKVLSDHGDKISLPKPRSIRRKHHKSSSVNTMLDSCEDGTIKRNSNSRKKNHSKKGLRMMLDEEHHKMDEEEIHIDKLLIHYSKKPSNYDVEETKKLHVQSLQQLVPHTKQPFRASEVVPMPSRSVSLPHDQVDSPSLQKSLNRSNTFQPDNQARHVHPKLPDYDELAAQFASLRGR